MTCTTKLRTDHFVNIAQWESALVVDGHKMSISAYDTPVNIVFYHLILSLSLFVA